MRPSRGMGAVNPEKMPRKKKQSFKLATLGHTDFKPYAEGGKVGLYDNINAKRKRIAKGSGEKMRSVGQAGAPTAEAFKQSAKTAKR